MVHTKNLADPLVPRRKLLLAGVEPSVQSLVSTFLVTMGWTCTVVATREEAPAVLQREAFDGVLIDVGPSVAGTERVIMMMKQIRPSLADRMLVMSNGPVDQEMMELIERYGLNQVSQEGLLQQLWVTLQDLVAPSRSRELPPRSMPLARMIFDSFRYPLPAGVRGSSPGARQLAYEYKRSIIDLSLDSAEAPGRISLAGQVLDAEKKGKNDGLSVVLAGSTGTLARTVTNQLGEFQMELAPADDLTLEVRLGERSWVLIPLGKMDWIRKRTSSSQAVG